MAKIGKRLKAIREGFDRTIGYKIDDAIAKVMKKSTAKFEESIDISIELGIDPKKTEQNVKGSVNLPHSNGKKFKIAVFAEGEDANDAKKAGADFVGSDDLIEKVKEGKVEFERVIATPEMMKKLSSIARILGPKGLMPNPKTGTVTKNILMTVDAMKKGMIEFKNDKFGSVKASIGRKSFESAKIKQNIESFLSQISKLKPQTRKGDLLRGVSISSTMGIGVKLDNAILKDYR